MTSLKWKFGRLAAVAALAVAAAVPGGPAAAQESALVETEVVFTSGDREVPATVIAPEGAQGAPGVVLVAGAGSGLGRDRYREHAEAFAEAGIAAMLYEKRGPEDGYSQVDGSIEDLADDANAAVEALRRVEGVDPGLVGLHGHSEGAWTVIEAASRSEAVAFVITSGGSALPPEDTQSWMARSLLEDSGVAPHLAVPLGERFIGALVAGDLYRLAGYDPLPALAGIDRPFLGVFAEHDINTPAAQTMALYRSALEAGGNGNYALRLVPGVEHSMYPSADGRTRDGDELDPGYVGIVAEWIGGLAAGEAGVVVDPAPEQALEATAVPEPAWYGTATALFAALGLFAVLFLAYPVAALVRRIAGRKALDAGAAARTVAVLGLAVPLLAFGYVAWLLPTGAQELLGPVVAGRPVAWLAVQALFAVLLVAAVAVGVRLWRRRAAIGTGSRVRYAALLAGVAVMIPWGAYWGLIG